jgi:hypothetical protein
MAAGLGFKTFTTGEVLTSADVNGYLMQGVLVFASEAARDAAITSPQEGQFAFTKDNNSLWYYDGAAWVASGATGDIEGVTAGTGISGGGTSGTVTITNSMATEIDAKGDLVVGTGADTFARLGVGANGTVLTAASGEATGLEWAAAAGGGALVTVKAETTVTAATSATADNVFTSAYTNYLIMGTFATSGNDVVSIKFRASGSSTSTNYTRQVLQGAGGTASAGRNTAQTSFATIASNSSTTLSSFNMSLFQPQLADETIINMPVTQHYADYDTIENTFLVGNQKSATAFDGIEFLVAAGTFELTYTIYGYSKVV